MLPNSARRYVLCNAKTESENTANCNPPIYSAMLDAFVVITKLMKWPENNFQLTMGCWKISLRPNQAFVKRGYKTNKKLSENCINLLLERLIIYY